MADLFVYDRHGEFTCRWCFIHLTNKYGWKVTPPKPVKIPEAEKEKKERNKKDGNTKQTEWHGS